MKEQVEKSGLNGFERLLVIVLIPAVFTIILIAVLFSLIDANLFQDIQRQAHQIPVIGSFIPAPKAVTDNTNTNADSPDDKIKQQDQRITDLNQKVADQLTTINSANAASIIQNNTIKSLQAQVTTLTDQLKAKTASDAEYAAQIQKTAQIYANMDPGKAALIINNLTLAEQVLIFSQMKQQDQVNILQKMDPAIAAKASIALKDIVPAKDQEIAALQARISAQDTNNKVQPLTNADLALTFASMTAANAADILMQLYSSTPAKVVAILSAMATQPRSQIITALDALSKPIAAAITAKLAP